MRWNGSKRGFSVAFYLLCNLWLLKWECITCILFLFKFNVNNLYIMVLYPLPFSPGKNSNRIIWPENQIWWRNYCQVSLHLVFSICMRLFGSHLILLIHKRCLLLCSGKAVWGLEGAWPWSCCEEYWIIPMSCLCCQFNTQVLFYALGALRMILPPEIIVLNFCEAGQHCAFF